MDECSVCGRRLVKLNEKEIVCKGCDEVEAWCECQPLSRFESQDDNDEVAADL